MPMVFYREGRPSAGMDTTLNCHGDDFLAEGTSRALDRLDDVLTQNFDTKVLPRIGPPAAGGQVTSGKHLGRTIRWTPQGFEWDGAQCHVDEVISLMKVHNPAEGGSSAPKGAATPASKDTGKAMRDREEPLSEARTATFRKAAGTALYVSMDRPTIQFAVAEIMAGMQSPTELHWARLHRLARYLWRYPEETWLFSYQDQPKKLELLADSDWAADRETRRSVSCLVERLGNHILEVSVAKQTVVALSSGESEFYAIVRAAAHGMQTRQLLGTVGVDAELEVLSDSSAGKAVVTRTGSGKIRHLELKELWIQQAHRERKFSLGIVDTLFNWADVGTKALEASRLDSLVKQMPLRREGRKATAALTSLIMAGLLLRPADGFAVGPLEVECSSNDDAQMLGCISAVVGIAAYVLTLQLLLCCLCSGGRICRGGLSQRTEAAAVSRCVETGTVRTSVGTQTNADDPRLSTREAPQVFQGDHTRTSPYRVEAMTLDSVDKGPRRRAAPQSEHGASARTSSSRDAAPTDASAAAGTDPTAMFRLLARLTVADLRSELRERRLSTAGSKVQLITRVSGATPLATERQAMYIESLVRQARDHVEAGNLDAPPAVELNDLMSTHLASRWIDRWRWLGQAPRRG